MLAVNLRRLARDRSGASAAEYALMVALVGGFIIASTISLTGSMKSVFTSVSNYLNTASSNFGK